VTPGSADPGGILALAAMFTAILITAAWLLWRRRGVSALVIDDDYEERTVA